MVKQATTRRSSAPRAELNGRDLLLAGLGAASLTRKQGIRAYAALVREGRAARGRVRATFATASARFQRELAAARGRIAPLRRQAEARLAELRRQLQPVLARFGGGVPKTARSRQVVARKAVARKQPARKPARKPARRKVA